jgi:hypothetical protein
MMVRVGPIYYIDESTKYDIIPSTTVTSTVTIPLLHALPLTTNSVAIDTGSYRVPRMVVRR